MCGSDAYIASIALVKSLFEELRMALINFYEKPGCLNNVRQKQLLARAGHMLIVHDLLSQSWADEPEKLLSFFRNKPVSDWFNPSAPKIKQGLLNPNSITELEAISAMVDDPILIRRPLLESDGIRIAGFDPVLVDAWIGLTPGSAERDWETCKRSETSTRCKP